MALTSSDSKGCPRLLMDDLNMGGDTSQFMSQHSIMYDLELKVWISLTIEVLTFDIWT